MRRAVCLPSGSHSPWNINAWASAREWRRNNHPLPQMIWVFPCPPSQSFLGCSGASWVHWVFCMLRSYFKHNKNLFEQLASIGRGSWWLLFSGLSSIGRPWSSFYRLPLFYQWFSCTNLAKLFLLPFRGSLSFSFVYAQTLRIMFFREIRVGCE